MIAARGGLGGMTLGCGIRSYCWARLFRHQYGYDVALCKDTATLTLLNAIQYCRMVSGEETRFIEGRSKHRITVSNVGVVLLYSCLFVVHGHAQCQRLAKKLSYGRGYWLHPLSVAYFPILDIQASLTAPFKPASWRPLPPCLRSPSRFPMFAPPCP